jgi:valyl-tRNA synthetase
MISPFPEAGQYLKDQDALKDMDLVKGVITGIRNIRGEMNIPPSKKVSVGIDVPGSREAEVLRSNQRHIQTLAKVDDLVIEAGLPKPEASATAVFGKTQVHVLLKGLLDFEEEKKRLRKEIEKIEKEVETAGRKLSNRGFLEKAPSEIVEEVKRKVEDLSARLEKLNQNLSFFETVGD